MKWLSCSNVPVLIRGASILSCGGGLSFPEQMHYFNKKILPQMTRKRLRILSVKELEVDAVYITIAEVGPTNKPPIDKSALAKMFEIFSKTTSKKIAGIIPVEIGQETITIDSALRLNLPIVDADLAGLRAVPEIQMNALHKQGVKFTLSPFVVFSKERGLKLADRTLSLEKDEKILRSFARESKDIILVLGGMITGGVVKKYLNFNSYSTAIKIGRSMKNRTDFTKYMPTSLELKIKAKINQIKTYETSGFFETAVSLESLDNKKQYILKVQNEYMEFFEKNNKKRGFAFPSYIILINQNESRGLNSGELTERQSVGVYVFEPYSFGRK